MVFSSLLFLFRFLPVVLFVYYIMACIDRWTGKKAVSHDGRENGGGCFWKNLVLFCFSLIFYAWGEPVYVVLMLFSTLVDYVNGGLAGYFVKRGKRGLARIFLVCSVVINLSLLGVFKYAGFFCGIWNEITGMAVNAKELALPIGISFYTFQTMSYTIDIYRGDAEPEKNIINFGAYVSLFPQLIAGPIVRFQEVAVQLRERKLSLEKMNYGILRFVVGLGKKVLLANNAGLVWTAVCGYTAGEMTAVAAWLGLLFYMFQIYFDFSGYSDMAVGLMAMLGFEIGENFRYPYTARSITEFWRRWHISLGTWFREYVYIPLGGNRKGKARTFFNIFAVWFLTGLWHGASWNFIFWGLYFWVFLMIEKQGILAWLARVPKLVGHVYALLVVYFGWLLFAWEDIERHRVFLRAMAGIGKAGVMDTQTAYLLATNFLLLVILALGSTELPKKAVEKVFGRGIGNGAAGKGAVRTGVFSLLQICFLAGVFLLSVAYLVNATYNPFLYFRF